MGEIKNTIIKTKNIKKSMTTFASEHFTPLNECDFEIQKTLTYIKTSLDDEFKHNYGYETNRLRNEAKLFFRNG